MTVLAPKMVAVSDDRILQALLEKLEPRLRRKFSEIVAWLRSRHSLKELQEMLSEGRAGELVREYRDFAAQASAKFGAEAQAVYLASGREIAEALSERLDKLVAIDQANPRAIRALDNMKRVFAREFTREQSDLVAAVIREHIRAGKHPRVAARALRDSLGLTQSQQQHVDNYRRLLEQLDADALKRKLRDRRFDRTVQNAIDSDKPLTPKQVDRMVARYRDRYIRHRARVVAHAEALGAVHGGSYEAWQQATDSGAIRESEIKRSWRTGPAGGKSKRRDFHRSIVTSGQVVGLRDSFVSGRGNRLRYPHDPDAPLSERIGCACQVITRLVPRSEPI